MDILAIGCEYSGTTTLLERLQEWMLENFGQHTIIHDHFKLPHASGHPPIDPPGIILTSQEKAQVMAMTPKVKEIFTRYALYYHTPSELGKSGEIGSIRSGHHIDDLIYGPHYFGYGGPEEPGDRRVEAQQIEQQLNDYAPGTVLVLVKASPTIIRRRMQDDTHESSVIRDQDVEFLLCRFEEEFHRSSIPNKFVLDTTESTPKLTFQQFLVEMEPYWSEADRLRMLTKGA